MTTAGDGRVPVAGPATIGPATIGSGSNGLGFRHEAAVYRGDQGFLDVTVDYVRDGLNAGQPVLVAVIPPKIDLLRAALGADADKVRFVDMAQAGRNPALIIPMWREVVEDGGGVPVRGIGEPVWFGRRPAELAEALLHEALLNIAFADGTDLLLRCPYDAQALGDAMVGHASLRHPVVVDRGGDGRGVGYHGVTEAAAEFTVPLPDAEASAPEAFEFDHVPTVRRLRAHVGERARTLGIDAERTADLMLAMHEIAVNSLRHGGGRGTLRLWADDDALVCEISDRGHIDQPLVGRVRPRPDQRSGRGVWLANQLCDLVQIRSSTAGTTVRMHVAR
jgi:anti-sigma regulatory factor (Ser/Thr protein kinase)